MSAPGEPAASPPPVSSSPCLAGERVSFTGTLASMTHQQAHELVEKNGGTASHHISRQTTMLIVGEEGWPLEADGRPSIKVQQAAEWQQDGVPVRIVREADWLRLLALDDRSGVRSLSTPAMLSKSLNVPIGTIRRWERLGLIRPVKKVFRLPYFDLEEARNVRRLGELLAAGIPRPQLEASLARLRTLLPHLDRSLVQLSVVADSSRLLIRDARGLLEPVSGQRQLDFSPAEFESQVAPGGAPTADIDDQPGPATIRMRPNGRAATADRPAPWTAEQWFEQGCQLLDDHDVSGAVEAFRLALMSRPGTPEINFHLAESLFRAGNADGALERYYAAVEADGNYLEAWTQIGCIHSNRGELPSALEAFQIALAVHDEYPDAHWNCADVLAQLSRFKEAAVHWRKYLQLDSDGPWAEQARQRLASSRNVGELH